MAHAATLLCRDCGRLGDANEPGNHCIACGSERLLRHPELPSLSIAHVDCDAYYASVEKRDRPELRDTPVLVGGSIRGVVTSGCYIARRYGVRSAMPMAWAVKLCPHAVVIKPDMEKYLRESRRIAELMRATAPTVQQVSIDEAYLDLSDGESDEPPARSLARLALQIERKIGVTVSIGLAPNKLLAKIASDLGKPRGFSIIGSTDALEVIGPLHVSALLGIGPAMTRKLEALGITLVRDLRDANEADLILRFGLWARRLMQYARAEDRRPVRTGRGAAVSVTAETTFNEDLARFDDIAPILDRLCGRVAQRLERADLAAGSLTLKLRRYDRHTITRACRVHRPTRRPEVMAEAASRVLAAEIGGGPFRLVGVIASHLLPGRQADPPDLFSAGH